MDIGGERQPAPDEMLLDLGLGTDEGGLQCRVSALVTDERRGGWSSAADSVISFARAESGSSLSVIDTGTGRRSSGWRVTTP